MYNNFQDVLTKISILTHSKPVIKGICYLDKIINNYRNNNNYQNN